MGKPTLAVSQNLELSNASSLIEFTADTVAGSMTIEVDLLEKTLGCTVRLFIIIATLDSDGTSVQTWIPVESAVTHLWSMYI